MNVSRCSTTTDTGSSARGNLIDRMRPWFDEIDFAPASTVRDVRW